VVEIVVEIVYASGTSGGPAYRIKAFGLRTVPHGGFAAVQDDIRMIFATLNFATRAWRSL
jgi:hypothetical protein